MFESSVILDGNKTYLVKISYITKFESSVILDGNKTLFISYLPADRFESSVILDGNKILMVNMYYLLGLRVEYSFIYRL